MSVLWNYFAHREEKSKTAERNLSNVSGIGCFNITNLLKPLQQHQEKEYEDFLQSTSAKKLRHIRARNS